ncbi:MAG: hypothetical protein GY851_25955 [bacterium]|nr:hypothetical protein [bacterium]
MTNRERVRATLNHQQPDAVPYHIEFTQVAHAKMVEYLGDADFASSLGNALSDLGTTPPGAWREVRPGIWEDQFGVQWDRSIDKDIGVVCNQVVMRENLEEVTFPDPHDPARWAGYANMRTDGNGEFWVPNLGFSLFERAWTLYGMENLLIAMASEPDVAHRLFDRILEFNLAIIEHACGYDVDAMMFGDDWGSQYGLIMGIDLWREFIGPRVRQMYQAVRAKGKYVIIHSCGKVDELFPDLIEAGLHCFNPFQPEVIDVFDAKRRYGGELSFFGGISTQRTLPYGTPEQVREEVKRLLDEVGKNGGLIAAPAHDTPADARPENIAAMIEVLQQQ